MILDAMSAAEVHSSRHFEASSSEVFRAHADPALLTQWWGPNGFTSTFHEFDFRPDGHWRFTFHGPDGKDYENEWRFRDLVENELIDFDHTVLPLFRMVISLEEAEGGTLVRWQMTFEKAEVLKAIRHIIEPANEENFDRLAAVLRSMPES